MASVSSFVSVQQVVENDGTPIRHNLPRSLTPFSGRKQECQQLLAALADSALRLVVLFGEGGIGKTRLALAVAQALVDIALLPGRPSRQSARSHGRQVAGKNNDADGIWFVGLNDVPAIPELPAAIQERIAAAIGQTLELPFNGVDALVSQLQRYLADKQMLLILDNMEHLAAGAELFDRLLQQAPRLRILVTSRLPLPLPREVRARAATWQLPIGGLAFPPLPSTIPNLSAGVETVEAVRAYEGVAYFCACAEAISPGFRLTLTNYTAVIRIGHLVNGSPLALALAARQLDFYSCAEVAAQIEEDYTSLTANQVAFVPNPRTIEAVFRSSWSLLGDAEAQILRQCVLLPSTFTQAAASQITGATPAQLQALLHKSLLTAVADGPRFAVHELIRQYARKEEPLVEPHVVQFRQRHAEYYLGCLAHYTYSMLQTPTHFKQMLDEWVHIRSAWRWSIAQQRFDLLQMGARGLANLYRLTGLYEEAVECFSEAITQVRQHLATPWPHQTATVQKLLAQLLSCVTEFYQYLAREADLYRTASELLDWSTQLHDFTLRALAYNDLARAGQLRGDNSTMRTMSEIACDLLATAEQPQSLAKALNTLGGSLLIVGDFHGAVSALQRALVLLDDGSNIDLRARIAFNLGLVYRSCREHMGTLAQLEEALRLGRLLHNYRCIALSVAALADQLRELGSWAQAATTYEEAIATFGLINEPYWAAWLHMSYGRFHHMRGDLAAADEQYRHCLALAVQHRMRMVEHRGSIFLGHLLTDLGLTLEAATAYQRALLIQQGLRLAVNSADVFVGRANLALVNQDPEEAQAQLVQALLRLTEHTLSKAIEPFYLYRQAIHILRTVGDPRAEELLQQACARLQKEADTISERRLRHSFLTNVAANRELLTWAGITIPIAVT